MIIIIIIIIMIYYSKTWLKNILFHILGSERAYKPQEPVLLRCDSAGRDNLTHWYILIITNILIPIICLIFSFENSTQFCFKNSTKWKNKFRLWPKNPWKIPLLDNLSFFDNFFVITSAFFNILQNGFLFGSSVIPGAFLMYNMNIFVKIGAGFGGRFGRVHSRRALPTCIVCISSTYVCFPLNG